MRKKLNGRVLAGLVILSVVLLVALLAPVLAPHDPYELGVPYLRPSAEHPLGTNDIGQDILSELIYGTRISLLIGVVSALAVTVVGTALGILSGYLGGWTDQIIMQVTNVAMALPSLPLTYWWYVPPILCISVSVLGFMLLSYYGEGPARGRGRKEEANAGN